MEFSNVGKFKDVDVFLISEGAQHYISFKSPDNYQYWVTALNKILFEIPDYKFTVKLSDTPNDELEVDIQEFKPFLYKINGLIDVNV